MGKWVVVERTVWVDTFSYSIPADLNHDGSYNDFYYEFGEKVLSKYSQFADKSYIFEDIEYFASGDTLIYTHWEGDTLYSTQRVGYQFDNEKLILRENLDWDPAEVINILIPHEGILPPTSWY
ncbi:MAG: hypothetical protein HQ556_14250 [Candidatus Marinimicrobia bacterium]|nr:hypothetical protein [Candidatus Neomarinimicrobiota bacterium]